MQDLPDGFVAAGFSNGGGMAEYVATQRPVSGVLMLSGALALDMIGVERWPAAVPAQIRYTVDDPFRNQAGIDAVLVKAREADADTAMFDYPGRGHLFTDPSLPDEFDPTAKELLWERVPRLQRAHRLTIVHRVRARSGSMTNEPQLVVEIRAGTRPPTLYSEGRRHGEPRFGWLENSLMGRPPND